MQSRLLLNTTQKTRVGNLFDKVVFSDSNSGYSSINYFVNTNNARFLSIVTTIETMGAYPDQFSTYFNFYTPTGELIYLNDLFGREDLQQLNKYLQQQRIVLIKEHVKLYEADSLTADDMDYMRTTLTDCNKEQNLQYFIIEKDSILFFNERCFPHAAMNFEANLAVKTPIKKLLLWLSNNGRALLGIHKAKPVLSGINKPFYGTINNKLGIVLQLDVWEDGSCHGMYYYTSQGIGIECSGSFINNQLSLQCSEESAEQFTGTYSNNTITGNWHHLKTGEVLSFAVKN